MLLPSIFERLPFPQNKVRVSSFRNVKQAHSKTWLTVITPEIKITTLNLDLSDVANRSGWSLKPFTHCFTLISKSNAEGTCRISHMKLQLEPHIVSNYQCTNNHEFRGRLQSGSMVWPELGQNIIQIIAREGAKKPPHVTVVIGFGRQRILVVATYGQAFPLYGTPTVAYFAVAISKGI